MIGLTEKRREREREEERKRGREEEREREFTGGTKVSFSIG